jgi:hypothetical protein
LHSVFTSNCRAFWLRERAIMITDNLYYIAMFAFIIMFIGLVLTFMEFRYGKPKRQQGGRE